MAYGDVRRRREGASVAYVNSSDNRGAGSWVGHQLCAYEDGEKVLFIIAKTKNLFGGTNDSDLKLDEDLLASEENKQTDDIMYKNCSETHAAGVTPYEGDPLDTVKSWIVMETALPVSSSRNGM